MEKIKNLESQIQTARPKLKRISLNLYLKNIAKFYCLLDKPFDDFKSITLKVVKDVLKDTTLTTLKNIVTALIVGISSYDKKSFDPIIKELQEYLKERTIEYTQIQMNQTKSERQAKNWIEYEDLIKRAKELYAEITEKELLKKKGNLTNQEFNLLQSYVLLATYVSKPLRNDFAEMKVVEKIPDDTDHNFLLKDGDKYTYILNVFKTRDKMGAKKLEVDPKIGKLYSRWLRINKSGYLFVKPSDRNKSMSPSDTTRILNGIFKPLKIGSSMIRHVVASYRDRGNKSIHEIQAENKKTEDDFLHSASMNKLYAKK